MHRFQQDHERIKIEAAGGCERKSGDAAEVRSADRRELDKGIVLEDPAVTLDVHRDRPFEPVVLTPLSMGKHGKTEQIVDAVLNESAVEHRRKT
jgi:hypothetical protein